ncbi:MAG: 30S ribosome-binding factor RbfA [Planctomycetia bacterium]|nr:30S ribosome-binding factor RbfA [Planctomycetia bacterium]
MSSRRIAKVAEALRETISMTVLFGLKDPRVKNVTVLRTEVSPDLKSARVYVSVMGDEKVQALAMHGLRSARGFIQSQIAERLELRYTPILSFVLDPGVKLSIETSSLIRQALSEPGSVAGGLSDGPGDSTDESIDDAGDEDAGDRSSFTAEAGGGADDAPDAGHPGSELEDTSE